MEPRELIHHIEEDASVPSGVASDSRATRGSASSLEPLLDDEWAAQFLGRIHRKTLQRMAREGKVPAYRLGRFWRYRASELNDWLRLQSTGRTARVVSIKEKPGDSRERVISKAVGFAKYVKVGADVWVDRWREQTPEGPRAAARKAGDTLRVDINKENWMPSTVKQLVNHYNGEGTPQQGAHYPVQRACVTQTAESRWMCTRKAGCRRSVWPKDAW